MGKIYKNTGFTFTWLFFIFMFIGIIFYMKASNGENTHDIIKYYILFIGTIIISVQFLLFGIMYNIKHNETIKKVNLKK